MASGENAGRPPLLSLVRKIFLMALRSLDRGWGGGGHVPARRARPCRPLALLALRGKPWVCCDCHGHGVL